MYRKALWLGETCEAGFVTTGKEYLIRDVQRNTKEVNTGKHCEFRNNFGQRDYARKDLFQLTEKYSMVNRRKLRRPSIVKSSS